MIKNQNDDSNIIEKQDFTVESMSNKDDNVQTMPKPTDGSIHPTIDSTYPLYLMHCSRFPEDFEFIEFVSNNFDLKSLESVSISTIANLKTDQVIEVCLDYAPE